MIISVQVNRTLEKILSITSNSQIPIRASYFSQWTEMLHVKGAL